jgi:dipeptidyl aminopeptidase/acylaminoacyl peptidase
MNRILASHFEDAQGRGDPTANSVEPSPAGCERPCRWAYSGQLQPYNIYIPPKLSDPRGYSLTLDLHGCNNPYFTSSLGGRSSQLASAGGGSIVVEGEARGPCYWYYGQAGADSFEIWADVAHRYRLNPDRAAVTGISMGGFGTYKLATSSPVPAPSCPARAPGRGGCLARPLPGASPQR